MNLSPKNNITVFSIPKGILFLYKKLFYKKSLSFGFYCLDKNLNYLIKKKIFKNLFYFNSLIRNLI